MIAIRTWLGLVFGLLAAGFGGLVAYGATVGPLPSDREATKVVATFLGQEGQWDFSGQTAGAHYNLDLTNYPAWLLGADNYMLGSAASAAETTLPDSWRQAEANSRMAAAGWTLVNDSSGRTVFNHRASRLVVQFETSTTAVTATRIHSTGNRAVVTLAAVFGAAVGVYASSRFAMLILPGGGFPRAIGFIAAGLASPVAAIMLGRSVVSLTRGEPWWVSTIPPWEPMFYIGLRLAVNLGLLFCIVAALSVTVRHTDRLRHINV